MTSILLTLSLACPATRVVNNSQLSWTKTDDQILVSSHNRCAIKYTNSPCLKHFSKQANRTHRAICGNSLPDTKITQR